MESNEDKKSLEDILCSLTKLHLLQQETILQLTKNNEYLQRQLVTVNEYLLRQLVETNLRVAEIKVNKITVIGNNNNVFQDIEKAFFDPLKESQF